MQDLANSLESAIKQHIDSFGFSCNVYTGQSASEKEHPSLVVHAEAGLENRSGSGNFTVNVNCEFRYPADTDELTTARSLANQVIGELMVDTLPATLTANYSSLCVFGIFNRAMRSTIDENHWLSVLSFDVYCCITDIAAS
jgi:hypothetical protein